MKRFALLCALVAFAGCISDGAKLRKVAYSAWAGYVIAEETAADVVTDKTVPADVVIKIQNATRVAAPVAEALYHDLSRFAALQDEIKAITDAGGDPTQARLASLAAAFTALQETYAQSGEAIAALVELVHPKRGK